MTIVHTHLAEPVKLDDILALKAEDIEAMPVLERGHFDNLKFRNKKFKLWQSRMTIADYDHDIKAFKREQFVVEKFVKGNWIRVASIGANPPLEADFQKTLAGRGAR